jgi:heme exporter protein A
MYAVEDRALFEYLSMLSSDCREMRNETTLTSKLSDPELSATPAVEVMQVARRFGERWALRGVSLRVEAGEVLALLGRNGSGKTTLLRILSTALRPTRGSGRVLGFDLVREASSIRGEIGVLGHSPGLYGDLTARENLRFALRMLGRKVDPTAIEDALEAVSLGREGDTSVRGFSAGMQRRLALARILLHRPRLLLLDEPYASFDPGGIELVNSYLVEHRERGGTAIVATHDLARASGVLDRVFELRDGRELAIAGGIAG